MRQDVLNEIRILLRGGDKEIMSKAAIAYFDLQLNNGSIIKIIAYNEMADYCYSKLRKNDFINIQGYLTDKFEVISQCINCLESNENFK